MTGTNVFFKKKKYINLIYSLSKCLILIFEATQSGQVPKNRIKYWLHQTSNVYLQHKLLVKIERIIHK